MNEVALLNTNSELRTLIYQAADSLVCAATAAEVLEARGKASFAYDAAKSAARLARARGARDEVVARCHRAQADALEIQSMADRRLADEIDGAQARGEIEKPGGRRGNQHGGIIPDGNNATLADVGLSAKDVFDARQVRDVIAADPGVLRRALDDILASGDEPTKARLRRELSPAVNDIRAAATAEKKERRTVREVELTARIQALPDRKYGLIYGDPEWRFEPYSRESGMDRAPENHYPTTRTDEIAARDIGSIAADDCVLFLWATAPMLEDALVVLKAWGFAYKTHLVWFKQRGGDGRGTGYWFTGEHELLLVGTRGNVPAPAPGTQWRSILIAPVGEHSEKPDAALELIEEYFPTLPKIELNRRGPARDGWDAWGNEAVHEPA
jgi:N6-adenosine-specific RNA methylase IME4